MIVAEFPRTYDSWFSQLFQALNFLNSSEHLIAVVFTAIHRCDSLLQEEKIDFSR